MKKLKESGFKQKYFSHKLPMRQQLFNIITFSGSVVSFVALCISFFVQLNVVTIVEQLIATIFCIVCFFVGNIQNCNEMVTVVLCLTVSCIFFPAIYFASGGITGGMLIWFLFGLVYEFMLLNRRQFIIIFPISCLVILSTIVISYYNPQYVKHFDTQLSMYTDNVQSLFLVAIALGLLLQFQFGVYIREQKELEKRSKELEEAIAEIRKVERDRQKFLADVSNEIRSPLNVMLGMNEMVRRESKNQTIIDYSTRVNTSGNMVLSLLNDIIDFNKIESKTYDIIPESYYLVDMLNSIYEVVIDRTDQKGLELIMDIDENLPEQLFGDEVSVRKVIINLITSAIRYTESGKIFLKIRQEAQGDNLCAMEISIRDTGTGMTQEEVDELYEIVQKSSIYGGHMIDQTGLELDISQSLLKLLGSNMEISSVYGEGSVFSFHLEQKIIDSTPIGQFEPEEIAYDSGVEEITFRAPGARVLVVDDNTLNHDVLKLLLQNFRVKVTTVSSGEACLEIVKGHKYHIIFMDCVMRDMDGFETLQRLKLQAENLSQDAKIIAMTTGTENKQDEELFAAGFCDKLEKPISGHDLERMLRKHLSKQLIKERDLSKTEQKFSVRKKGSGWITPERLLQDYHVNVNHGMIYFAGMRTQYYEILQEVANSIPSQIEQLRMLVASPDDYAVHIHGIKANAKTIGANFLYLITKEHEQKANEGDTEYLKTHIDELESEANYVRKGILKFFESR